MTAPDAAVDPLARMAEARAGVERALEAVAVDATAGFPEPLGEAVRYALATRGKRLRPLLCCGAHAAVAGQGAASPDVYALAAALEIVHTYSLVHDDLPCMDDDDLRRGRPTVHRVHGERLAVLAGAALVPVAVEVALGALVRMGASAGVRRAVVRELCRASGAAGMVGGQLLDLEAESRPIDGTELERIHRAKTGALLTASLRIGAIAAGASSRQLEGVTAYGSCLGLAFQIVDDVLDVTAASEVLGKTAGKDLSAGKATYPALYGVDGARRMARERIEEAIDRLRRAGIDSPELVSLALYVLDRAS